MQNSELADAILIHPVELLLNFESGEASVVLLNVADASSQFLGHERKHFGTNLILQAHRYTHNHTLLDLVNSGTQLVENLFVIIVTSHAKQRVNQVTCLLPE